MSGTEFTNGLDESSGHEQGQRQGQGQKPDPVFLPDENSNLRKPLGLEIEKRQQRLENTARGPRLSRHELETLLDVYYARNEGMATASPGHQHHAEIAGGRMVRNLALISSLALLMGFALGFYSLSQQGSETPLGQNFNRLLNGVWHQFSSVQTGPTQTGLAQAGLVNPGKQAANQTVYSSGKPIKTASLVVADATGSVHAGIPLKLSLNTDSKMALVEVKIMNVPGDAVLTAGKRRSDGVWILQPGDLKNVALVMSSDRRTPLRLDVELVEAKTGQLLSPTREIRVAITAPKQFKVGGL